MRPASKHTMIALLAAIVLLLLTAGVWFDHRYRRTVFPGFCPAGSYLSVAVGDFPAFFEGIQESALARAADTHQWIVWSEYSAEIEQLAGVPLQADRWGFWMGPSMLFACSPEGVGVCVKPGLLFRAFYVLHNPRSVFRNNALPTESRTGAFHAWHEGFLIIGSSAGFVKESVGSAPYSTLVAPGTCRITIGAAQSFVMSVSGDDTLSFKGEWRTAAGDRAGGVTLISDWPPDAMFVINGAVWDKSMWSTARDAVTHGQYGVLARNFLDSLYDKWGLPNKVSIPGRLDVEWAFGIERVEFAGVLPVPEVAVAVRDVNSVLEGPPLDLLFEKGAAYPYEWAGQEGVLLPILGPQLVLSRLNKGTDWFLGSQVDTLGPFAATLFQNRFIPADYCVRLNWQHFAEVAQEWLRTVLSLELAPSAMVAPLSRNLFPMTDTLAECGYAYGTARSAGDKIIFQGALASPSDTITWRAQRRQEP